MMVVTTRTATVSKTPKTRLIWCLACGRWHYLLLARRVSPVFSSESVTDGVKQARPVSREKMMPMMLMMLRVSEGRRGGESGADLLTGARKLWRTKIERREQVSLTPREATKTRSPPPIDPARKRTVPRRIRPRTFAMNPWVETVVVPGRDPQ